MLGVVWGWLRQTCSGPHASQLPPQHRTFLPHLRLLPASIAASESSGLPAGQRGTYKGLAEKVEHLKELGVNAGGPRNPSGMDGGCTCGWRVDGMHLSQTPQKRRGGWHRRSLAPLTRLLLCAPPDLPVLCAVELLPVFEYDELEFQRA